MTLICINGLMWWYSHTIITDEQYNEIKLKHNVSVLDETYFQGDTYQESLISTITYPITRGSEYFCE